MASRERDHPVEDLSGEPTVGAGSERTQRQSDRVLPDLPRSANDRTALEHAIADAQRAGASLRFDELAERVGASVVMAVTTTDYLVMV